MHNKKFIEFGYRTDLFKGGLRTTLDHIRWIAALAVTASHLRVATFPDASAKLGLSLAAKIFYFATLFGNQAVIVFFVASGLLVGGSLLKLISAKNPFRGRYVIDRASRLYVVLIPATIFTVVFAFCGLTTTCNNTDSWSTISLNILLLQNIIAEPLCNNHPLWSLSSEAFFYAAAPIVLLALRDKTPALLACLVGVIIVCVISWKGNVYSPAFGFVIWTLGVLPWFIKINIQRYYAIMPFIVILLMKRVGFIDEHMASHFAIGICFVAFLSSNHGSLRETKMAKLGSTLAGFSYSLYLIHMPLLQAMASYMHGRLNPSSTYAYVIFGAELSVIVLVSWCFGFFFERRTDSFRLALKSIFTRSPQQI